MAGVEAQSDQSPRGLWLSSPKVIGTVSGELNLPPHPRTSSRHICLLVRLYCLD